MVVLFHGGDRLAGSEISCKFSVRGDEVSTRPREEAVEAALGIC